MVTGISDMVSYIYLITSQCIPEPYVSCHTFVFVITQKCIYVPQHRLSDSGDGNWGVKICVLLFKNVVDS